MASNEFYDAIESVPDNDVGSDDKFKKAMWRVTGFYSQFKQKMRSNKAATTSLHVAPTQFNIEYAKDKFADFEQQYNRLCNGLSVAGYIASENEDNSKKVEEKQEKAKGEFENARDQFLAEMNRAMTTPKLNPATQATGARQKVIKPFNEALKPFVLELDHMPHEYRKWKRAMASYFKSNAIDEEEPEVQNEYVTACISSELDNFIAADLEDKTPAYDADAGIMSLLERIYNLRHTMTSKRLALFLCKAKSGESPVAFIARLNQLYQEADLATMTVDQIRIFLLISGITNNTLRKKLIEMDNPTYEQVCAKVNTWTATTTTSKAIEKSQGNDAKAKVVKGGNDGKDKGKGRKRTDPPANIKIHPGSMEGKCYCCGSSSHEKQNCDRFSKARCTACKNTGHYANVCLAEYIAWRNKTFNITPKKDSKGKGKAKKTEVDDEIKSAPPSDGEYESSQE